MNQRKGPAANEIGSGWMKQTQNGDDYVSIKFNENAANFDLTNCFVDMYFNTKKMNPRAPDYRIVAKAKTVQPVRQAPQPRPSNFPRPKNFAPQQAAASNSAWDDSDPGDDGSGVRF